ncbi:MAG: T9SS type A sorting domain-containing protein [Bacteroidia bacterium]
MLKRLKLLHFFILFFIFINVVNAQDWIKKIQDPNVNFYDVQKSYNKFKKQKQIKDKLKKLFSFGKYQVQEDEGYFYKRWEYFIYPRVYPSGNRSLLQNNALESENLISNHTYKSAMQQGGNWQPLGAFTIPTNGGGAGRLNCIRFHPTNQNIIYVGSPSGGLWKTTDGGLSWTTNTDALPTLGITDIAIDAINPNIIYLATGDAFGSGGDTHGVGILKSIDGGTTWHITGLNWTTNQARHVSRIIIHPNNSNILFAAASNGIYRSLDAGVTWTRVSSASNVKDLELKPGDPTTIYAASSSSFYKSTNTGASYSIVSVGLPSTSNVARIAIAVTAANPEHVYLIYTDDTDYGFMGLYRSSNSGSSFNLQSNSPNVIGYEYDGSDIGGNGWYTLSIAASPTSENEIVVGGVNIWKSYDGGLTWNINAHWYGDNNLPYVHADIHDLIYRPDGESCYASTDGGIFVTTDGGNTWVDYSNGLQIGQMYRLGGAATNSSIILQGWQDNGTNIVNNNNWSAILGGDGMECFIDWSDPNYMYAEYQYGEIHRSEDGGFTFEYIKNNITEDGEWVTPWAQDPINTQTIYAGYKNVWKSTDRGDTWTAISSFNSNGLTCLAVAKSNPAYIYASDGYTLYKTIDGGINWITLTNPPGSSNIITYITISETTPDKIWITFSGYTANKKVYKSTDGGSNWQNISFNLPNIPTNCIVNQTNTNDGVYIGTDVGVYYTDATMNSWIPYSNGLPNVIVNELEIHYASNKLRAATYGRGLWETAIYNPSSNAPFANFAADTLSGCPGLMVTFSDSTLNNPTAWQWSFPGGSPSSSTLQNPTVTYNTAGSYNNVTLIVSNNNGTDSITRYSYIAISPQIVPLITLNNNDSICQGQNVALTSSIGNKFRWQPNNQTSQTITASTTNTYSVKVTDALGCETTSLPITITVLPKPSIPNIIVSGDTLVSSASSGNQWYYNDSVINGATNQTYITNGIAGLYQVKVTDSIGFCSSISQSITIGIEEYSNGIQFLMYPNPSNGLYQLLIKSIEKDDISIEIIDTRGRQVYLNNVDSFIGEINTNIDISTYSKGIYNLNIKNSKGNASKKIIKY